MSRYPRFVTVDLNLKTTNESYSNAEGDQWEQKAQQIMDNVWSSIKNCLPGKDGWKKKDSPDAGLNRACGQIPAKCDVTSGGLSDRKRYKACAAKYLEQQASLGGGTVIQCSGRPHIYLYVNGVKRWFPNETIYNKYGRPAPTMMSCEEIAKIPDGPDMDSTITTSQPDGLGGGGSAGGSGGWGTGNIGTGGGLGAGVDPTKYPDIPSEKFWGIEKPAAYFVYGGLGIAVTVVGIWAVKKFVFKK